MKRRSDYIEISEPKLEHLYYVEGLTQGQIANDSASAPRPSATAWLNTGLSPAPPKIISA